MKGVYALLSRTAEGALVTNGDCQVRYWNPAAERILGFSSQEVLGKPCNEVLRGKTLHGQPWCTPLCTVAQRLREGKGVRNFDIQTTTKSGQVVWLNVSSIPLPSGKKGRYVIVHLFHEIKAMEKIRQLTELLYRMVGGQTAPITIDNGEGRPSMNRAERLQSLSLTAREQEILYGLAEGLTTKALADRLCISYATARNHIQHILEKLGAHSRLEALAMAFGPRSQ